MPATRPSSRTTEIRCNRKLTTDFSKVGGLSNHIKILRDTIIFPLLHNNVYAHFNVKTPRGVLFYGPPGTGKTLVAGALATELNREGLGKVTFYQRKGSDVLDKWVGESEKKLRALFELATKTRPSIIFFDELDGLAPIRSTKNDHVHCSIVTTLLALMDGLDSVPGVIVIGATNRIEFVDPALRRPGRFDRELYFPLPSKDGRREILQVHMQTWRRKPSAKFVQELAENSSGFCGSDLQALCAEALLCAMKRTHPNIQNLLATKIKIEADEIQIEEVDFVNAKLGLVPASSKLGSRTRKLNAVVAPLLQRQLDVILTRLKMLWPHFFEHFHKYAMERERYIGRLVLVGSNLEGLNSHLVPAILQNFEHLPALFLEAASLQNKDLLSNFFKNLPSILVIPHIDELWSYLDVIEQNYITSLLDDIHSSLPILIIATHEEELPIMLQNFFYNNTSLIINIDNPSEQEVEEFFFPVFFGECLLSLSSILTNSTKQAEEKNRESFDHNRQRSCKIYKLNQSGKINKSRPNLKQKTRITPEQDVSRANSMDFGDVRKSDTTESLCTLCGTVEKKKRLALILAELLQRSLSCFIGRKSPNRPHGDKNSRLKQNYEDSDDMERQRIYALWKRTVYQTAKGMPIGQLEVLYDTISACISIHKNDFQNLTTNLEMTLAQIELAK